jgi:TFIIF-interacting CTD phosphatase-like protein
MDNTSYRVHHRPGVKAFMNKLMALSQFVDVGVWTAATPAYASRILDTILPDWRRRLVFFKTRNSCTALPDGTLIKDLRRLKDWNDVLLVDDNAWTEQYNTRFNNRSVYRIRPYKGANPEDRELSRCSRLIHRQLVAQAPLSALSRISSRGK